MKKYLSMLMAITLAATAMVGCGGNTSSSSSTASTTKANDSSSASTTAPVENLGPAPTVTWYVFGNKAVDHDKVLESVNQDLSEKINVKLDLQVIPDGEFNDKMKLISSSGENYDLTFTASWRNNFTENLSRDAFMDITDLYTQYGQDIKAQVPDWLTAGATINGNLYAIPNNQILATVPQLSIQKSMLEKYNFDITTVKTARDVEPFLELIKQNEPQLFGIHLTQPVEVLPYYEVVNNNYIKLDDPTFTVVTPPSEATAPQARLKNEWYKKGYIRQDIGTVTNENQAADIKVNRFACLLTTTYKPGGDAALAIAQGIEYVSVPIGTPFVNAGAATSTMTAMNSNSKNPEAAMKLLNLVYTDKDIFNKLIFGLEGEHYKKVSDNRVEPVADSKYLYAPNAWVFGNQFNAYYMPGQEDGVWEATDKLNRSSDISKLMGFVFDPTPVQAEVAQVAAVNKEFYNVDFTAKDVDAYIKDSTEKAQAAGSAKIAAELQRQIDEWAKANGKK